MKGKSTELSYPYLTAANVREAFPELGNPVLQDWMKRGLASGKQKERGDAPGYFLYSPAQVIHFGLLSELSRHGVLRDLAHVGVELPHGSALEITEPDQIINYCVIQDFQIGVAVRNWVHSPDQDWIVTGRRDKRLKRSYVWFVISFTPLKKMVEEAAKWLQQQPGHLLAQPSMLFISLATIAAHVKNTFGLMGE